LSTKNTTNTKRIWLDFLFVVFVFFVDDFFFSPCYFIGKCSCRRYDVVSPLVAAGIPK